MPTAFRGEGGAADFYFYLGGGLRDVEDGGAHALIFVCNLVSSTSLASSCISSIRSWCYSEKNKRRTLQKEDIQAAIRKTEIFDFLVDVIQ